MTIKGRQLLDHFLSKWVQKSYRPPSKFSPLKETNDKLFGITTRDLREYRFHIGQLKFFQEYLAGLGYDQGLYFIDIEEIHIPVEITAQVKDTFKLRDKQPEAADFLINKMEGDNNSRLLTMPTGTGKGLVSIWAACERSFRFMYVILPSYIQKTTTELIEKTTLTEKDIMVVQGGDALRGLIDLGKTGQYKSQVVLISMKTWTMFIDAYIEDKDTCVSVQYGCAPEHLYEYLGIGTVLFDEIHQHIHGVYRTFCFMHQDRAIGMSATYMSADPFVDRIQKMMFPKEIRFENIAPKKYIRAYGISYGISSIYLDKIRTTERGSSNYSQNAYEVSILKHKVILANYLRLIFEVFENGFLESYKPGHKCIIFVRRIDMCDAIVNFLKLKCPDLDIRRYSADLDPYENLLDPDVRVTTQQSAGTAHDIPGLVTNITLDNIDSQQSNVQCLGRLREPPEATARYFAVYSGSIDKHVRYQRNRQELFKDRVASFKEFRSNVSL